MNQTYLNPAGPTRRPLLLSPFFFSLYGWAPPFELTHLPASLPPTPLPPTSPDRCPPSAAPQAAPGPASSPFGSTLAARPVLQWRSLILRHSRAQPHRAIFARFCTPRQAPLRLASQSRPRCSTGRCLHRAHLSHVREPRRQLRPRCRRSCHRRPRGTPSHHCLPRLH
jgi:hypothetical protein